MKRQTPRFLPFVLLVFATALVGACGQSSSPTAPSMVTGASPLAPASSSGATVVGQVTGTSSTSSSSTSKLTPQSSSGLTVTVVGTGISTTVDGSGNFTLSNVPPGDATLQFTGQGTNATVAISGLAAGQQIQITVTVNGSSASIDSESGGGGNSTTELEGLIQSIDTTAGTFVVNGTTVSVSSTTSITHGSTTLQLSDLQVGWRVHVKGTTQNGVLAATSITVQDQQPAPPETTNLNGTLAAAPTGTCPSVTFTLNGTTVTTSSATQFSGGTCSDLAAGVKVEVNGTQATGSTTVTATSVSMEIPETEISGTLAVAPTGACPSVTFTVNGTTVTTSSSTQFSGGTCTDLVVGAKVEVTGTTSGGTVAATKISIEKPEPVDLSGTLAAAPTGACPAVTFTLGSSTVTTSSATEFSGGTCTDLVVGAKVEVTGTPSGGIVTATKVSIEKPEAQDVSGTLAAAPSGACPDVTFTVSSTTVTTSSSTTFQGGACTTLAAGTKVEATGPETGTNMTATKVSIESQSGGSGGDGI